MYDLDLKGQIMILYLFFLLIKRKFIYGFDLYLDKPKHNNQTYMLRIFTWPWPLLPDIDLYTTFTNEVKYYNFALSFFFIYLDRTKHLWPNQHLGWFWYDLDSHMTLTWKIWTWPWTLYEFYPQGQNLLWLSHF